MPPIERTVLQWPIIPRTPPRQPTPRPETLDGLARRIDALTDGQRLAIADQIVEFGLTDDEKATITWMVENYERLNNPAVQS